jgi:hypothetical protein
MSKFNWVLLTVLVTATMSSWPIGSSQITRAQTGASTSEDIAQTTTKDNAPPTNPKVPLPTRRGTSRSSNPWTPILQALQDNPPPPKKNEGGSRGVCAIAPTAIGTSTEIWSERPLFVWVGPSRPTRIELRSVDNNQVLWRHKVEAQNKILYDGEALQPGQAYEWSLFASSQENARPIKTETFRLMDAQKRDRMNTQLQRLDQELQAKNASTEDIARKRAEYFAQQQLWSDVLKEAYSVENPSPGLTDMVRSIPRTLCSRPGKQNSVQPRQ